MHSFLTSIVPDIKPCPDVLSLIPEKSLGIDEVREIIRFLSKRPLMADRNVVIIHSAEKLTLPAQNALLKVLEEPPGNSHIYLVTSNPDSLLPTVLSRLNQIDKDIKHVETPDTKKTEGLLNNLLAEKNVGGRLTIIDSIWFTRESALEFLNQIEHILHHQAGGKQKLETKDLGDIFTLLHKTRVLLTANVNVRLAMDHFAIDLPIKPIEPDS